MMYYEEGNPREFVSPDVFVTFGVPPDPRRPIWKTWEEGKLADFVMEVTSHTTQHRDEVFKKQLYQRLGVREYWQYDPTGDYLDPILKCRRLGAEGVYEDVPLTMSADGVVYGVSEVLGLHLCLHGDRLRYRDPMTSEYLRTYGETQQVITELARTVEEQKRAIEDLQRLVEDRR